MQLHWKTSFSATCLHAAACLAEGLPVADQKLSDALKLPVTELVRELEACGLSVESTLPLLVSLAAEYESNRQLAEVAFKKLRGASDLQDEAVSRLAGRVTDIEATVLRTRPQLLEELSVRCRPLREQWEARGPGLLKQMRRFVDDDAFLASAAEIVLVAPIVGGHGRAHLQGNRVVFEAVLANPHAELPEILRLGWLLGQLNFDLPRFGDSVSGNRLSQLAGLATVPLVLAAAEEVELVSSAHEMLDQTLAYWHLPTESSERLQQWWQAYSTGQVRWTVALAGLDAMFSK